MKKKLSFAFHAIKMVEASIVTVSNDCRTYVLNGNRAQDKSNSATSPYRINSKIESLERVDSEWDIGHSQGGVEWN